MDYDAENWSEWIDPDTGTRLTPGYHGEQYLGNGEHPGIECCCDECDYYLRCFLDWREWDGAIGQ